MSAGSMQLLHFARGRAWFATLAVAAVMLASAASASAANWKVTRTSDTAPATGTCSTGSCSLRQAVAAATTGDTVVVPASSSPYVLTHGQLVINNAITIRGAGVKRTVIEAQAPGRVMVIYGNAARVQIEGLKITGGNTTSTGGSGGGIAAAGPLALDHVAVTGNIVDTATTPSTFDGGGGGVFSSASLLVKHSTITHNAVSVPSSAGDGGGGGILMNQTSDNSDDLTLVDSTVSHNTVTVTPDGSSGVDANGGGGIYNDGGDLTIVGSLIADNTANVSTGTTNSSTPTDGGGGIFQFGNAFVLEDSTVAGNVAHGPGISRGGGGGILDSGNISDYVNSTIVGNRTDAPVATNEGDSDGGGGVLLNNVKYGVTMASMTIDGNRAVPAVGGGINTNDTDPTALYMADSIIANNTDSGPDRNCAGAVYSVGYNLTNDFSCQIGGPGALFNANPRLGALANHGGPTPTQALGSGSAAINRGDPNGCLDLVGGVLSTDQRGAARPTAGHGRCDIGAYEVAHPAVHAGRTSYLRGSSVKLRAVINAEGQRTGYYLQYAPAASRSYRSHTRTRTLRARMANSTVDFRLGHLRHHTTYRYRLVATNVAGKSYGPTGYFTTRN